MGKCIFFDIDGVLNKKSQWKRPYSLNDGCIKEFSTFMVRECTDIILMSSWRSGFVATNSTENSPQIKELESRFKECGIQITDKTPILRGRTRDKEIERYLYLHKDIQFYTIIDDDPKEYGKKMKGLYLVDCTRGFSAVDAKRVQFVGRDAECI